MSCDELSVAAPDAANLSSVTLRSDVQNWRDVIARQESGDSRTARWSTGAVLAIEVRPDGSVARACVARGSDLLSLDRSWLEAITIARFRQAVVREKGSWLRYEGR
ncbi:MAG: hypothetical protein R3314_14220 [Longimicrobiales bacterium]|nr:hypothetical protein [Longimicrobiales bacterium]